MASSNDNINMAVFCDFENVALGVRDANYEKFDIKPVLERLLLKGNIVVKKAYCDWDRYKGFKATMHEANFELIEIPHVRQSGKNSADIRLVVDALDLCYTKSHVNSFVIISGDSDFSPLVSKLRENAKYVIGVGVKQSTSDLLIANCDEFIFYDDLVRESRRVAAKRDARVAEPAPKRSPDEASQRKEELEVRKSQAIEMAVDTFDALVSERGDSGKIWASMLKEAIKRRKPDFSESYYGFRTFGNLLEEAQNRGLLEFGRDEKSGAYVYRSASTGGAGSEGVLDVGTVLDVLESTPQEEQPRRSNRAGRKPAAGRRDGREGHAHRPAGGDAVLEPALEPVFEPVNEVAPAPAVPQASQQTRESSESRRGGRGARGRSGRDQSGRTATGERATLEPSMFEPATPAPERATLEPSMFEPATPAPAPERATLEPTMFEPAPAFEPASVVVTPAADEQRASEPARKSRAPRKPAAKKVLAEVAAPAAQPAEATPAEATPAEATPKAKPAARSRRPRKTESAPE
jgi:uncharacterized LabA/DUF88 family protein